MPSPLYQQFNGGGNGSIFDFVQRFKADPIGCLAKKYNIPPNLNDPNAILQHLLNSGQVSQADMNRVMQMVNNPQIRNMLGK